jgi:hypothetical protein
VDAPASSPRRRHPLIRRSSSASTPTRSPGRKTSGTRASIGGRTTCVARLRSTSAATGGASAKNAACGVRAVSANDVRGGRRFFMPPIAPTMRTERIDHHSLSFSPGVSSSASAARATATMFDGCACGFSLIQTSAFLSLAISASLASRMSARMYSTSSGQTGCYVTKALPHPLVRIRSGTSPIVGLLSDGGGETALHAFLKCLRSHLLRVFSECVCVGEGADSGHHFVASTIPSRIKCSVSRGGL